MLKPLNSAGAVTDIGSAVFPKPFLNELEYNCPVHENWNIVHTGMLLPETHQIYVCPDNCMRGVVMTADEMGLSGRFSCVMVSEKETVDGKLEEITIEGVTDLIRRLPCRPRAVELFLVCIHHFVGADERHIFHVLEQRFPDIQFLHCWMDPIMQKIALTPEQKQRKSMLQPIMEMPEDAGVVNVLGDNLRLPESSDLSRILEKHGIRIQQVQDIRNFDDYRKMGNAFLNITRSALSVYGVKALSERLGRPFLYLPPACSEEEIKKEAAALIEAVYRKENAGTEAFERNTAETEEYAETVHAAAMQEAEDFLKPLQLRCEEAFAHYLEKAGRIPVAIDYLAHPRPLGLARILLQHGIPVSIVYLDVISPEEKADFDWLKANAAGLLLQSTNHVKSRVLKRGGEKVLCIGPKSAYFQDSPYFVNMIENDGNWGCDGILHLLEKMEEALDHPKDTKGTVTRKGLGMETVL